MDDLAFQTVVHKKDRKPKSETKPLPLPVQDDEPWVVSVPDWNERLEPDVRNVEEVTFCTPHRRDLIFSKARAAVIAHNRSAFAYFCDPVRIEALTVSTTTFSGAESNVQKLALVLWKDVVVRISLKLVRTAKGMRRAGLVLFCNVWPGWQRFEDYLSSIRLSLCKDAETGEQGWKQQRIWWSKNDKCFRLMDLPAEVRAMVLKHAIGERRYPVRPNLGAFWYCGDGSEGKRYEPWDNLFLVDPVHQVDPTKAVVDKPNLNAIIAHPKLYSEMKEHLVSQIPQAFEDAPTMRRWIQQGALSRRPGGMNSLQHLTLDFTHEEYISFFAVHVFPFTLVSPASATILTNLPQLKSVESHFRSTIRSACAGPWGYKGSFNGYGSYQDVHGNNSGQFLTACQKILVDWILTFAKSYIEHVPRVYLTDYIKDSTRTKWNSILQEARSGRVSEFDIKAAKDVIRAWPVHDLPPRCTCTSLCAFTGRSVNQHKEECEVTDCTICHFHCHPWEDDPPRIHRREYQFDFKD